MSEPTSKPNLHKPFFVNQFVNTVYGILLGFGFSNSMSQIETQIEGGKSIGVSTPFSIAAVIYVIIVICVYWWDWVDNVGFRVKSTSREFALDISILVSLEFLFFVFEYPVIFSSTFFLLALLNLLWVYNLRFDEYQSKKSSNDIDSWSKYLEENRRAKRHIVNRWYGVALFGSCVLLSALAKEYDIDSKIIVGLTHSEEIAEGLKGNWVVLTLILCAGFINRVVLYRDRFEPNH